MIVTKLDVGVLTPKNIIESYKSDLGYAFEIEEALDKEIDAQSKIDAKLVQEVADEILAEVKMVVCHCHSEKAQHVDPDAKAIAEAKVEAKLINTEIKNISELKIAKEELKLPIRYRMMKKLYHRLDNYLEKLLTKYEKITTAVNDGKINLKPLRVINTLLENIDKVQKFFIDRIELIEKKSGHDITIFDPALDKIEDLEEKLTHLKKELTWCLRTKPTKHIVRIDTEGTISCGF